MATEAEAVVLRFRGGDRGVAQDCVAVERPLQIRVLSPDGPHVVTTTMRTPGHDEGLAVGFLFAERVIETKGDVNGTRQVAEDVVVVELATYAEEALKAAERPFLTTGACGVCGRGDMDALLEVSPSSVATDMRLVPSVVCELPTGLRSAQETFARTGGLHAAGLFDKDGRARLVREDVGRHNAVDKVVGALLMERQLPAVDGILVVSGRASFELVQKAARAGIPVMAAVGAPSSLAIETARRAGMTLLGFVRDDGFNVYCGEERLPEPPLFEGRR